MISIRNNAPNEYYIGLAYSESEEVFFGATDKNLPATIEKAVTGREKDITDLFGGRRSIGSFMIDFTMFQGKSALMIESAYALYTNIGQSIPLAKAESIAKDINKLLKGTTNAYSHFVLNTLWNMFRINKHLSASRLFNLKPLETCEKYAEEFRANYKNLLSLNEKKRLVQNSSAITVSQESGFTVIYAKAEYFEALCAEYVAELKRRKIYCRKCKSCGQAIRFRSRNKLLCDDCTTASIANSKKEHRLAENGDMVLRKNKEYLRSLYNFSHSVALRKRSPEQQQWFAEHFAKYKADAKAIIKQYKVGEVSRKEALAELKLLNDEVYMFSA